MSKKRVGAVGPIQIRGDLLHARENGQRNAPSGRAGIQLSKLAGDVEDLVVGVEPPYHHAVARDEGKQAPDRVKERACEDGYAGGPVVLVRAGEIVERSVGSRIKVGAVVMVAARCDGIRCDVAG